ncbi:MAG: DUF3990 domain-containing protein [Lactobacillales bacterium]|jgi:hypothetical protein|nr:DUF3990 domain-containing protein [Lactobacillales bacterium]
MLIYHGSNIEIQRPNPFKYSKTRLDFGRGFYTTTSEEQARKFTKAVLAKNNGNGVATVNCYEFDLKGFQDLNIKDFSGVTNEWFDYVEKNRRTDFGKIIDYDMVIGPVADDNVMPTFVLYEQDILLKKEAIRRLKTWVLKDQIVFKSEKSLEFLTFVSYKEVENNE